MPELNDRKDPERINVRIGSPEILGLSPGVVRWSVVGAKVGLKWKKSNSQFTVVQSQHLVIRAYK